MPRAGAEPSQQVEARRHLAEAGKVVLDEKRAVIAERLGLDIILDEVAEALAAVGVGAAAPGLGTAKKSKSHWFDLLGPGLGNGITARIGARRGARLRPDSRALPIRCGDRLRPGPPKSRSRNRSRR